MKYLFFISLLCFSFLNLLKAQTNNTFTNYIGIQFVKITKGRFKMGNKKKGNFKNEKPQHLITISNDFYIGKHEITQEQWEMVMGENPSSNQGNNKPVEMVNWEMVQKFITKLNTDDKKHYYRLPSEAEWEYAAGGGDRAKKTTYAGGKKAKKVAWFNENSQMESHDVGLKFPNSIGLYDMSGNVAEWCSDWYSENYYANSLNRDPKGAENGIYKVFRGGGWYNVKTGVRITDRSFGKLQEANNYLGLRLVMQ